MRWIKDLLYRLDALLRRDKHERELRDEFEFHLEMEARKLVESGMDPDEARRVAHVRFGGTERFRDQTRASWGTSGLTEIVGDVRFGLRQLARRPAFSLLAALTLGLGIGGTVALFSVVDGLLLRPLPVEDEDRLVTFYNAYDWRGAEYDFVRERARAFEDVAAYTDNAATMDVEDGARLVLYSLVSANLFDVLGTRAHVGRTFVEGEDRPGAEPVVVLAYDLWQREFAGDPDVLGRRVVLDDMTRTVVGVMPRGFFYPSPESDAWVPLDLDPADGAYHGNGWLVLTGRLRDGVTSEQLSADLDRIAAALGENWDYPEAWDKSRDPWVVSTREHLVGDVQAPLVLLLGAVGLVMLMACANVAALLVTRTSDRTGEMAVRVSLGAGRGRLARQILTESILLGLGAGVVGTGIALAAFDVLVASLPLPRELGATLALDWVALCAGLVLAVASGAIVSLAPMHDLLRGNLSRSAFGSRHASGTGRGRGRLQHALVVAEVLMAVVLTTGTALLIRTVGELRSIDAGLDPEGVMTVEVILPGTEGGAGSRAAFPETLLERVRALPGVTSAGLVHRVPVRDGGWQAGIQVAERPDLIGESRPTAYYRPVSPGALETLGVELAEGRWFTEADGPETPSVAIVNETFARTMYPDGNAIGGMIERNGFDPGPIRIVGVVRNAAVTGLVGEVPMAVYYPWRQATGIGGYATVVLRTPLDPVDFVAPVREITTELNPRAVLSRTASMTEVIDGAMSEPLRLRFFLGLFSLLGIVLGTVGVYGIVSYSVQRRRPEYGVRLALGARPGDLVGEIVRGGMVPVILGVLLGAAVALLGSSLLARFLFGIRPTDPVSLAAASAVLLVAGAAAAFMPALRASSTDPAVALRSD